LRFILHATALEGDDELLRLIDRLVDRAADEVHRVEVPDADLLQDSGWYTSARQTRRKIITAAVAVPPRQHVDPYAPHSKQFEVRHLDDARIADKLAHTPLTILVEDREADGVLLDIFVEELGSPELRFLWKRGQEVTPRAFEFENSGGINAMPQRIERAVNDANGEGRPIRIFVICDSDQRWPGDNGLGRSQTSIDSLRQNCAALSIPLHVLQKRNAENYIPDDVVEAMRDDQRNIRQVDRFNALLRRSPSQRDHFPVKDGLSDVERMGALAAGLYTPVEEPDLDLLKDRLFPKKPRPLLRLKDERRANFTGPGLRIRDGKNEIDILLNTISREL
jgi:hypothetical protein